MSEWYNKLLYYFIYGFYVVNFVVLMGLNFWFKDYKFYVLDGLMNIINIYLVF